MNWFHIIFHKIFLDGEIKTNLFNTKVYETVFLAVLHCGEELQTMDIFHLSEMYLV